MYPWGRPGQTIVFCGPGHPLGRLTQSPLAPVFRSNSGSRSDGQGKPKGVREDLSRKPSWLRGPNAQQWVNGATALPCSHVDACIRPAASATPIPGLDRHGIAKAHLRDSLALQLFLVWSPTFQTRHNSKRPRGRVAEYRPIEAGSGPAPEHRWLRFGYPGWRASMVSDARLLARRFLGGLTKSNAFIR